MKRIVVLITLVMIVLTGCNENVEDRIHDSYKIVGFGDWGIITPHTIIPRGPAFSKLQLIYDTLLWQNNNGEIINLIADQWEHKEGVYKFRISQQIKWHDGEHLTPEDIVFTINYYKKHQLPWIDIGVISDYYQDGDWIVIATGKEYTPFVRNVACSMPILPKHVYENIDNPYEITSIDYCVGSGPFRMNAYSATSGNYSFEAVADYYKGAVKVKGIDFVSVSQEQALKAFSQGHFDLMLPSGEMTEQVKRKGVELSCGLGMLTKLNFNLTKEPFNDIRFRKAIAYAIDQEEVIKVAKRGHGLKGESGIIPKQSQFYSDNMISYDSDIEQVSSLLLDMGYEKSRRFYEKNNQRLSIEILGYPDVKSDLEVIGKQLENMGIETKLVIKDLVTCDQLIRDGDYDLAITETGVNGDPVYINHLIKNEAPKDFKEQETILVGLLDQHITAESNEKRKEVLAHVQVELGNTLPFYPLYYSKLYAAYNEKLPIKFADEGYGIGVNIPINKTSFIDGLK